MFIDTHAHLYLDQFNEDLVEIMDRVIQANIHQVLLPNIDEQTMDDVLKLTSQYPKVCKPMVGLHPCSVKKEWLEEVKALKRYLTDERIIAIGEIGIDLYWDQSLQQEQEEAFRYQIAIALEHDLPIVIHSRSAMDRTIALVRESQNGSLRGVFHCFDQSLDHAQQIMELGFYMGIGGVITYKRNNQLREAVAEIPLDYLILETDAPYLPPVPYRGKRNESSYIPIIAQQIADVKQVGIDLIASATTRNAQILFCI